MHQNQIKMLINREHPLVAFIHTLSQNKDYGESKCIIALTVKENEM